MPALRRSIKKVYLATLSLIVSAMVRTKTASQKELMAPSEMRRAKNACRYVFQQCFG
jgi:hypothetical protein